MAHRTATVKHVVLQTLHERAVLAARWHAVLKVIGTQLAAAMLREGLAAWVEHWLLGRAKKAAIYRALGFYFEQSKRVAFNALRCGLDLATQGSWDEHYAPGLL